MIFQVANSNRVILHVYSTFEYRLPLPPFFFVAPLALKPALSRNFLISESSLLLTRLFFGPWQRIARSHLLAKERKREQRRGLEPSTLGIVSKLRVSPLLHDAPLIQTIKLFYFKDEGTTSYDIIAGNGRERFMNVVSVNNFYFFKYCLNSPFK